MQFDLEVEQTLPGFTIAGVGTQKPYCVLNEDTPVGLVDRIIQKSQKWNVTFNWSVDGPVANAMGPCKWYLSVYLLKLSGPGGANVAKTLPYAYQIGNPIPDTYTVKVEIPAGAIQDGMYKLYTSVDIKSDPPGAVIPVTMFGAGPVMKFYTP